mmetsp:Transcript_15240/g.16955  ORF Transcript_15240/g.16955 Transcript_15240/m.16955 type:complete len:887 (-) Transcript_15240:55-2715(-)
MEGGPKESIKLIDIEDVGSSHEKFNITSEGAQFLGSLGKKKLAVVAVCGPQRTGKSYLSSRIVGVNEGFKIEGTQNPCTKGIWMWPETIPIREDTDLLVLDTEGLGSQEHAHLDVKLFSLGILLSSFLIYNSKDKAINEEALNNLSLVINITQHIQVQASKKEEDGRQFHNYFPEFMWVLRDFSLNLQGKRPGDYLEDCLKTVSSLNPDAMQKNQIRKVITKFFPNRDLECLVIPTNDISKLRRLDQASFDNDLRVEFQTGIERLVRKIRDNAPVKVINGIALTGPMLLGFIIEYLDAINSGGVPTILSTLDRLVAVELKNLISELVAKYTHEMGEYLDETKMPFDEEDLMNGHERSSNVVFDEYEKSSSMFEKRPENLKYIKKLRKKIKEKFDTALSLNKSASEMYCRGILDSMRSLESQLLYIDTYPHDGDKVMTELREKVQNCIDQYLEHARGPMKYQILEEFQRTYCTDLYLKLLQKIHVKYEEERKTLDTNLNKSKENLKKSREGESRLRSEIERMDNNNRIKQERFREEKMELQQKIAGLEYQTQVLEREKESTISANNNTAQEAQQMLEGKIKEYQQQMLKLKDELQDFKIKLSKSEDEKEYLSRELETKKSDVTKLKSDLQDARDFEGEIQDQPKYEAKMLDGLMQACRQSISQLESCQSNDTEEMLRLSHLLTQKKKDLNTLKESYELDKLRWTRDQNQKINEARERIESEKAKEIRELKDKLVSLEREKSKSSDACDENKTLEAELAVNKQKLRNLVERDEELTEENERCRRQIQVQYEVTEKYSKDIEGLHNKVMDLEAEYAQVKSQKDSAIADTDSLFDFMFNLCSKVLKKPTQSIRDAFSRLNLDNMKRVLETLKVLEISVPGLQEIYEDHRR